VVDRHGQVIDVLVSTRRDAAAARQFFARALRAGPSPAEVTTDRARVYPRVVEDLVAAARHVTEQYANNVIEADHGLLIAARTDVAVVAVKVDPAENAAGTPARIVRLSIPPSVLPGLLTTLPAGYRPDRISSPTQNNTQLTELSWGVTLTPQPTLS
jgi:DDE domain